MLLTILVRRKYFWNAVSVAVCIFTLLTPEWIIHIRYLRIYMM
jgi:hypothetical protein